MNVIYFIQKNKSKSDDIVTSYYRDVIKKAFDNSGYKSVTKKYKEPFDKNTYFYVDTILDAIYYIIRGYRKCIIWIQGVVPEESYMRNASNIRFLFLSLIEKYVLKKSKIIFLVSNEMKSHYENKYRLDLKNKSIIMPCLNESKTADGIFETNTRYDIDTFVYVGGLQKWQCFDKTVELYKKIEDNSNNKSKLFVFTFDKLKAKAILEKYKIKNYEVDSVTKEELSERLKRIKYGFVLRENNVVNRVATPTKFSNYIANGIIPIYSSCIKSFAEYDKTIQLGINYDFDRSEECLAKILQHMERKVSSNQIKAKCERFFSDYYNSDKYIAEIMEFIKNLG